MFLRYQIAGLLTTLAFAAGLFAACGPKPVSPMVSEISVAPGTTILMGKSASLTIQASGTDLQFRWTSSRGRLSSSTAPSVLYTAPDSPGPDTVTVEVMSKGSSTVRAITFQVVEPTPTLTVMPPQASTPMPTEQPSRTPTLTPTRISGVYCTDSGSGGTEIISIEPPRTVARIRIDMEERATEHGNSLWEVEAYGPETGDTNLVIGGTADASTVQSGVGCEECFAYKAVDGDTTTRWSSDWEDPQWLEIALPTPQVVNRIVLKWEQAFAEEYCVTVAQVTVVLSDFETDVQSWQPAEGDREVATGIDWADGALRCDFVFAPPYAESPHASYCLEVSAPMRDWTRFVKLMFEAKSLVNPSFQMKATISLATGSDYCWNELGDFQPVGQQWKTLILELDQAKYKVCPDFINYTENLNNKDDVRQLCVVVVADGGEPEGSILIDNVRLVGE